MTYLFLIDSLQKMIFKSGIVFNVASADTIVTLTALAIIPILVNFYTTP